MAETEIAAALDHLNATLFHLADTSAARTDRMRRFAVPAVLGSVETSLGHEAVQSFAFEAAEMLAGLREVLVAEPLAVHRARLLRGGLRGLAPSAVEALDEMADLLAANLADWPYGRDVDAVVSWLTPSG